MVGEKSGTTEQRINSEILSLFNEGKDVNSILDRTVSLLAEHLKCIALGVRVMDKNGNIPYQTYFGFTDGFLAKESHLCIRTDKCACIEIAKGEYDPSQPLYTPYGSFFTTNLQGLEPVRDGMKAGRFRGECVRSGWESLALIPMRFGHKYYGLIHAVDNRKDGLTTRNVQFLENVAAQMALYMHSLETGAERESEFSALLQRILHDLRNPLTSMSVFAELVASETGKDNPAVADMLERISRNAEYMAELVEKLGEFAHACDPAPRSAQDVNLDEFVATVVADMAVREKTGVNVVVAQNLPAVKYSQFCLRRILANLVSNAAKFSSMNDRPEIEIACQEKDMFYQISVRDNGMGMGPDEVEQVFRPFYRTKEAKGIPGTGLGLSICRKIVEKNGGNIWVYSDKGKGSTFYFTLPK